ELFGHVRGAFTNAVSHRDGRFTVANGGTIFLDEIGDMPLEMQAKLLRVLQDGEVRPVGSNEARRVDVRVVAASHRDLAAMCAAGEFREDLYYRLNVVTLEVPALRDRPGDLIHLITHFSALLTEELGRVVAVSEEARGALEAYGWPGNVRELENELRRAAVLSSGEIERGDLREEVGGG
ncbi:MAG: sigma 54-interacting transcriptional regulator, partial [Planctomycetes bacterium]|nr:sigma 54-interacting transcriptional regulator [Planctomycetota bacterium]